jgi:hypothetical protein
MRIASFRVRFARPVDFAFARACLERFSRRE